MSLGSKFSLAVTGQPPPELPDSDTVDTRLLAWRPTKRETEWETIGWQGSERDALRVAARADLPVFLLVCPVHPQSGPIGALGVRIRQLLMPPSPWLSLLRERWVPAVESDPAFGRGAVARDPAGTGVEPPAGSIVSGDDRIELRNSSGRVLRFFGGTAWPDTVLLDALRRHGAANPQATGSPKSPPWRPPTVPDGGLRLGVVSRFLGRDTGGWRRLEAPDSHRSSVPSREWVLLDALESLRLGPREGHAMPGETWEVDTRVADRIGRAIVPLAFDTRIGRTPFLKCRIKAEVTQIGRGCTVRLSGDFQMELARTQAAGVLPCTGNWVGYAVFGADRLPRKFRLCTHRALYGAHPFGAVVGEE
jgi:hypothetical protein